MVDVSEIGVSAFLVQVDDKDQGQSISHKFRSFTENERKIAFMYREITAIVCGLEIYEFLIFGSKHPITMFTDHKPILSLFARRGNIKPRFLR